MPTPTCRFFSQAQGRAVERSVAPMSQLWTPADEGLTHIITVLRRYKKEMLNGMPPQQAKEVEEKIRKIKATKLPVGMPASLAKKRGDAEAVKKPTGYLIGDIDDLASEQEVEEAKHWLWDQPWVCACWVSTTGLGIKFLVKLDPVPQTVEEHTAAFEVVKRHCTRYPLDRSGRNAERLCFVSVDTNALCDWLKPPLQWQQAAPQSTQTPTDAPQSTTDDDPDLLDGILDRSSRKRKRAWQKPATTQAPTDRPDAYSLAEITDLLMAIRVWAEEGEEERVVYDDYDLWFKIICAAKGAHQDGDIDCKTKDLISLLERWSQQSSKYKKGDIEHKWVSVPHPESTMATLLEFADYNQYQASEQLAGESDTIPKKTPQVKPVSKKGRKNKQQPDTADDIDLLARTFGHFLLDAERGRLFCKERDGSYVPWDDQAGKHWVARAITRLRQEEGLPSPTDWAIRQIHSLGPSLLTHWRYDSIQQAVEPIQSMRGYIPVDGHGLYHWRSGRIQAPALPTLQSKFLLPFLPDPALGKAIPHQHSPVAQAVQYVDPILTAIAGTMATDGSVDGKRFITLIQGEANRGKTAITDAFEFIEPLAGFMVRRDAEDIRKAKSFAKVLGPMTASQVVIFDEVGDLLADFATRAAPINWIGSALKFILGHKLAVEFKGRDDIYIPRACTAVLLMGNEPTLSLFPWHKPGMVSRVAYVLDLSMCPGMNKPMPGELYLALATKEGATMLVHRLAYHIHQIAQHGPPAWMVEQTEQLIAEYTEEQRPDREAHVQVLQTLFKYEKDSRLTNAEIAAHIKQAQVKGSCPPDCPTPTQNQKAFPPVIQQALGESVVRYRTGQSRGYEHIALKTQ